MICDFLFFINFTKLLQIITKLLQNLKRKENEQSLEYFFNDYSYHYFKITFHNKTITKGSETK